MIHNFSRCLEMSIFSVLSPSMFQSQKKLTLSCGISVESQKLSNTASVFECGRAEVHVSVIWS